MITALDTKKTLKYKSVNDTSGEPTYFILGIISHKEMLELQSGWNENNTAALTYDLVLKSLKGWENFKDAENKEIAFIEAQDNLKYLPLNLIIELGNEVLKLNNLLPAEKKI